MMRKGLLLGASLLLALPAIAATNHPVSLDESSARIIQVSASAGSPVHQSITLGLGKSAVVELDTEAHDVLVSSPDIVDAVVRSPKRIFLLGLKTGQTNAFFFDSEGHQIVSIDIRVEKDVTDLATMMKANLPNSAIKVTALNDNVVLSGSVSSAQESTRAQDLATSFTGDPKKVVNMLGIAGGEQVMLKVRIAEMDRNIAKQFGVNLGGALNEAGVPIALSTSNPFGLLGHALSDASGAQIGQSCAGAFFPTGGTSSTSTLNTGNSTVNTLTNSSTNINNVSNNPNLLEPGVALGTSVLGSAVQTITSAAAPTVAATANSATNCLSPNNAQGALTALEQVGLVHILAEPNLTAVSGETAKFLAGGEFPVPVAKDNQGNITVDFKTFGVGLSFTPVVLSPGRISLQISTEDSELTTTGAFTLQGGTATVNGQTTNVPGVTIPALSVRRAETTVELPSGGSFAIAGLMQHETKQVIDGFPGLKDMPVLGALFRSRDFENDETELVVLVSAYLVNPNTASAYAAPTDGFVAPTDPETLLLGRLNAVYKKTDKPLTPEAAAPVGFVVR
jgi:pilus assembly protein CpaC